MTRSENSVKNMYTSLINQILIILFRFFTRSVFIKYLGEQYLGINGLFSNVLNLLSLADLGIGTALIYSLYKPIVKKDYEKQKIIVKYLKKVYFIIGLIIVLIGFILLPFLNSFIKEEVNYINIYIVFIIYIFQTASSYLFFASNNEFLKANQKSFIANKISNIITIISNLTQIVLIIVFKNFYIYLLSILFFNVLQTAIVSYRTKKMYPFIKDKTRETLSKEERKNIFKDCGSLMVYRINYVVLTATDNIIISKYLGLAIVGIYSNYVLITNSIVNVLSSFFASINASIGNLHASDEKEKDYFMFKLVNFITVVCFGVFSLSLYNLINKFITIWIGDSYLLSAYVVLIIAINLYVEGLRNFLTTFRTSYGLFRQAKLVPLLGMVVNIVLSVILVKKIGVLGVLLGTLISNLISFMWFDPYIIYKNVFKKSPVEYYIKNILYFVFFVVIGYLCSIICEFINIDGIFGFIVCGVICVTIPTIIIIMLYYNNEYGKYLRYFVKNTFNKLTRREKK